MGRAQRPLPRSGLKNFCHPVVGDLALDFDALTIPGDEALILTCYTAEPETPTADALSLLASWSATTDRPAGANRAGADPVEGRAT